MMTVMQRYDPTKRATACPPVGRVPGAMQRDLERLLGPAFQVIP